MKNRKQHFKNADSRHHQKGKENGSVVHGGGKNTRYQEIHEQQSDTEDMFPNWSPWLLYCVTLAIRISYVRRKANWWIYHPDEIYQAIEVGHSLVFGYGFRTYEYFLPPGNITTSIDEQEKENGMYSMRSFLFPQFYAAAFWIMNCFRFSYSPYVVARILHVVVTSSLPVAVFKFSQTLYNNANIAWMAAILTAFSQHLAVLGTHTIVNSFVSPFVFFSLNNIFSIVFPILSNTISDHVESSLPEETRPIPNGTLKTQNCMNDNAPKSVLIKNKSRGSKLQSIRRKISKKILGCLFSDLFILCANGFVIGLLCYIRIDTALFYAIILFTFAIATFSRGTFATTVKHLVTSAFGVCFGLLVGGFNDKLQYGIWFISPMQWYNLNLRTNIPSVLFGIQGIDAYINSIFFQGIFITFFNLIVVVSLWICIITDDVIKTDKRNTLAAICACVLLFCCYSCVGHKELRFMHNFMVLQLILSAFSIYTVLCKVLVNAMSLLQSKYAICIIIGTYICNSFMYFPSTSTDIDSVLTKKLVDSSEINVCLDFVSQQNDAKAVFIDDSIYQSGGFSILRRDIPILVLIHSEYHEYSSRNESVQSSYRNRFINRFSDFIWVTNYEYLTKFLLENLAYNYIVTRGLRQRSYEDIGYGAIYNFGSHIVMKRELDVKMRSTAKNYAETLKMGSNATVLEYEASWLFTAGLYDKAVLRAERAAEIDDSRVRIYQILGLSYVKMERYREALNVEKRCFQRHGESICRTPQQRIVLQPDYIPFDQVRAYK